MPPPAEAQIADGTELILVRHRQTVWNVEDRIQGSEDSPLTEVGVAQAQLLSVRLSTSGSKPISACYASPLGRTRRTAELIMAGREDLAIVYEPGLAERCAGCLEGLTVAEKSAKFPDVVASDAAGDDDYAPPGGESRVQVQERVLRALASIASRHPGERVLIVTHSAVLASLSRKVLNVRRDPRSGRLALNHGAINLLSWRNGRWDVVLWGDTGEFSAGSKAGFWVIDTAAALRLLGLGMAAGVAVGLGIARLLMRRR